jgi:hypothetical protein
MTNCVEIASNVRIENPADLPETNSNGQGIERYVCPASRSESIREAEEIRLVDGVEHLRHGPLDNLILQCRNA